MSHSKIRISQNGKNYACMTVKFIHFTSSGRIFASFPMSGLFLTSEWCSISTSADGLQSFLQHISIIYRDRQLIPTYYTQSH
jgi:hypothetical protein